MKTETKLNILANSQHGEFGFSTCSHIQQMDMIDLLINDNFRVELDALNPHGSEFMNHLFDNGISMTSVVASHNCFFIVLEGKFDALAKVIDNFWVDDTLLEMIEPNH